MLRRHGTDPLVYRNDPAGVRGVVLAGLDELVLGILDLGEQSEPRPLELPEDEDAASRFQSVLEVLLVEPHRLELSGLVLRDHLYDLEVPAPRALHPDRDHLDFDRRLLARLDVPDLESPAPVLVSKREIKEEVVDGSYPRFRERVRFAGPTPFTNWMGYRYRA
jgi:hypothetical protein